MCCGAGAILDATAHSAAAEAGPRQWLGGVAVVYTTHRLPAVHGWHDAGEEPGRGM